MEKENGASCGCAIAILIFNLILGGWSVDYLLSVFAHTIPFGWEMVIGIFTGQFTVPIAIIVAILKHFGVL